MNSIGIILKEHGPMLSGPLAEIYSKTHNASNDAARKAISRARSPIQKIKTFAFENNQVFCYLEEQYNSPQYKDSLYAALKNHSATISPILTALENNYGFCSKAMLSIYSASPITNTKGHRLIDRNISDLLSATIIFKYDDEYYVLNESFSGISNEFSYFKSNVKICNIICKDFISWASRVNMIAYNSANAFPDTAEFSHFQWSITCPSYIQPIYNFSDGVPGFIVADVLFSSYTTATDIKYFINKINIIRHFRNAPNFLPVLLVNKLSPDALALLKENKVFVGILSNLYDSRYTDILSNIYTVFQHATSILLNDPSKIDTLIDSIIKNEGRFNNAIGNLFEYMVGAFFRKLGVSYLELNKFIPNDKGTKNELDILVDKDNTIIAIECKAQKSPVSHKYVEKWLSEIVPTFRKWIQYTYPTKKYEFQIWSVSGFDDSALELLEAHKSSTTKYKLSYLAKDDMIQLAKEYDDKTFLHQMSDLFAEY